MSSPTARHRSFSAGLIEVHDGLRGMLADVIAVARGERPASPDEVPRRVDGYARFLIGHHHVEEQVIFPGLRRHGHLRSSDLAFLELRQREHIEIQRAGDALARATGLAVIAHAAHRLQVIVVPHFLEEELGLSPERLAEMIDDEQLAELDRHMEQVRGGSR